MKSKGSSEQIIIDVIGEYNGKVLEKIDPIQLCFDSRIFGSVVLAYCNIKELKTLRLVSRSFQAIVKKELLSRTFITFDCIYSHRTCFSGFLRLSDIVRLKFEEDFDILWNINNVPKTFWEQMNNTKHLSIDNGVKSAKVFEVLCAYFKTISSLVIEGSMPSKELPETLTHLEFGDSCVGPLIKLPDSLTHLKFGKLFNDTIEYIPPSLTHLEFGQKFDSPVDHLPGSLTHLEFGGCFNQPIDHLPGSLVQLKLGFNFNRSIDNLPDSITRLSLGYCFNRPLKRLPSRLTHLALGEEFKQVVSHLLPDSLVRLEFGSQFTESLKSLPALLTHLTLSGYAYRSIPHESAELVLRDSLKRLILRVSFWGSDGIGECCTNRRCLNKRFPEFVEHLVVTGTLAMDWSTLSELKHLTSLKIVTNSIDVDLDNNYKFQHEAVEEGLDKLPDSITHLSLEGFFDQPVIRWPRFLTHLTLGEHFNQLVEGLPKTLRQLKFGNHFDQKIDSLPNGLVHLKLGTSFNQKVDKLPDSIEHLSFGYAFNQKVDHLPRSLITLEFGEQFNRAVNKLPDSVEKIVFGSRFNRRVDRLPNKVTELIFGSNFKQSWSNLPESNVRVDCYNSFRSRFSTYYPTKRQTAEQKPKRKEAESDFSWC